MHMGTLSHTRRCTHTHVHVHSLPRVLLLALGYQEVVKRKKGALGGTMI